MKKLGALAVVILLVPSPAHAAPQDVANDISNSIMSPYCDGVTLHDCPSQAAEDLRAQILAWVEAGWSRDRIVAELESRFGAEQISGRPSVGGSGLLAWLLPGLALLGGSALAVALVRRWTRRTRPVEAPVSAEDRGRVDLELAAYRGER